MHSFLHRICSPGRVKSHDVLLARMASGFRSYIWDPFLIVSQIATMQSIFYLGFGLWLCFVDLVLEVPQSLDHIFSYRVSTFDYLCLHAVFSISWKLKCHILPSVCVLCHKGLICRSTHCIVWCQSSRMVQCLQNCVDFLLNSLLTLKRVNLSIILQGWTLKNIWKKVHKTRPCAI